MKVQVEREQDGRWIAEVPVISGAMAYGGTRDEAVAKVEALVLRILADRLISLDAVLQREPAQGEHQTDVILLTHRCIEADIDAAIDAIEMLATVLSRGVRLRLEDLD